MPGNRVIPWESSSGFRVTQFLLMLSISVTNHYWLSSIDLGQISKLYLIDLYWIFDFQIFLLDHFEKWSPRIVSGFLNRKNLAFTSKWVDHTPQHRKGLLRTSRWTESRSQSNENNLFVLNPFVLLRKKTMIVIQETWINWGVCGIFSYTS